MQNQKPNALLLIIVITVGVTSTSLATLTNRILITNRGRIQTNLVLDTCDGTGNWQVHSSKEPPNTGDNTLEVDTIDKVEGAASLKMTFAATGPNWGGYFARTGKWNLKDTPVLRMRFKAHNPLPANFRLNIRSGANEEVSGYEILSKVASIGEWLTIDIDLRQPTWGQLFPDLSNVVWIEFANWDTRLTEPIAFSVDLIEVLPGPVIPLEARIKPESAWTEVEVPVSFKVDVKGGVEPYSYAWYVNGSLQSGASSFTYTPTTEGNFTVQCVITDAQSSNVNVAASLKAVVITPPPPSPPSSDVFKSEIRGIFIHNWMLRNPNWTKIAETSLRYGINTIFIEIGPTEIYDRTTGKAKFYPPLKTAVDVFHQYGLNVHVLANILFNSIEGMTIKYPDGSTDAWLCPTKNATRQAWKSMIESLVRDYNIDGFMFDYIRWKNTRMCFCDECKAKFIADTGLSNVVWPDDALEGGQYYWQFLQWRLNPITEFVRDAVQWMRAVKPNILISAAVFTAFDNCGNYWVMSIGQHTADWVDKGYLDFVSPMIYTSNPSGAVSNMFDSMNFYTGGVEGKVPMVPFITFLQMPDEFTPMPVETFVEVVRQLKLNGADGWVIWRYGGPGFENDPFRKFADIRAHLAGLIDAGLMPPVWAIQSFSVTMNAEGTQATISWTTTVPTIGRIEYSNTSIFNGTIRYGDFGRPLYYKDINYVGGTIIENTTYDTFHSFTIPITDTTQFRIQSIDENGKIVTSCIILVKPQS